MEPLQKQITDLPSRFMALSARVRWMILGGVALAMAVGAVVFISGSDNGYQYAFTNLTTEDSAEAATALKNAGIPFRLDAGGSALAVPGNKVYDARLLLAGAGLPKGGGVGFELFDRGDLGVSEFTQKVNLRRAIEGELARTISRLSEVRSARVHLTLSEKGLFRDEDRKASAAIVVNLQPGRNLGEREVSGIRHLVASAVPGLQMANVTVVDGRGAVLSGDTGYGETENNYQKKLEKDLEQRIVSILEPVVGPGAVLAKVNASLDAAEVRTNSEVYDPDATALRSERKVLSNQSQDQTSGGNVAGAAANQPLVPPLAATGAGSRGSANAQDEVRNFEVSKTVTSTVEKLPRLRRLSLAIVIAAPDGKTRTDAEVARLGEIAKRAVGYDEDRGDQIDISSATFAHASDETTAAAAAAAKPAIPKLYLYGAAGVGGLLVLGILYMLMKPKARPQAASPVVLRPGAKVAELEAAALAAANKAAVAAEADKPALPDPDAVVQAKARQLASADANRAALLIRAWIAADMELAIAAQAKANQNQMHSEAR
jgi:flagellar M-ring protein FliF